MYIPALITALDNNERERKFTRSCYDTLVSKKHELVVSIDSRKHPRMLAQKWNEWLDSYRGTYYDYLFVTANDVEHKEQSIDYLVDFAQQNNIDVVSGSLGRNYEHFSEIDDIVFSTDIADRMDTPAFLIKKGVIEKVGRVDEYFPLEFVERDYFYRAELAGFKVAGAKMKLHYHPDESVTVGYNNERFQKAFDRYVQKWGGDALKEQFTYPFNDMSLDFTYCKV